MLSLLCNHWYMILTICLSHFCWKVSNITSEMIHHKSKCYSKGVSIPGSYMWRYQVQISAHTQAIVGGLSWFSSVPPGTCWNSILHYAMTAFFHPFQLIIHYLSLNLIPHNIVRKCAFILY